MERLKLDIERCSSSVLGDGRRNDLHDVIVVDHERFERAGSRQAAHEIARFNAELAAEGISYILIGVGRWGSADPWLGIPVTWEQISGARVIVECGFRDQSYFTKVFKRYRSTTPWRYRREASGGAGRNTK